MIVEDNMTTLVDPSSEEIKRIGQLLDGPVEVTSVSSATDDYKTKWASSEISIDDNSMMNTDASLADDMYFPIDSELPVFADEECKKIHYLTKQLERERDDASEKIKDNEERISMMQEHLHNIRQEIDQTNALVAAKSNEISTEKHLIALSEREMGAILSDMKTTDASISREKERLRSIQNEIHVVTDEKEKLKMDLNWNQEELEQWATAAAKKEGDTLVLQKYTRADEMIIKELTLKLENTTKRSIEKKAQLENEITETKTKQLEVDRLAKAFRVQHEERCLLVEQWQETVDAMKARDHDIDVLSKKYTELKQTLNKHLGVLVRKKEDLSELKSEKEILVTEIEAAERIVQSKRQERYTAQTNLLSFQDELESLKLESMASSTSLEQKKALLGATETELNEKVKQLDTFRARFDEIKARLEEETNFTISKEKLTRTVEERLVERKKELKSKEYLVDSLKQQMFKDSQLVAQLRRNESNIIVEIRSTQATTKNLSAKINQLEKERSRQDELLYNAEFQLQQMERKVARGLGERSQEEKKQLQIRVSELEQEYQVYKDKQATLVQQVKKLHQELQKWQKKRDNCGRDESRLSENIVNVELEISACELKMRKLVTLKEEEMVSHDLVKLEVRRLRDILRQRIEKITLLETEQENILNNVLAKKTEIQIHNEVKAAQLKAFEDERHKSAVELGQRKIAAEKIQLKHEALVKAHGNDDTSREENSPVYHLITAAQKKAELQRQGDSLDTEIRKREKELKTMEYTLSHLRERNTDFRSSFARVDKNAKECHELSLLEDEIKSSEKTLLEAKKQFQLSKKRYNNDQKQIIAMQKSLNLLTEERDSLEETKSRLNAEIAKIVHDIEENQAKVKEKRTIHRQRDYPFLALTDNEDSLQEILFRTEVNETHTSQVIQMLVEIGREFPDIRHSIMNSLSQEKIEIQF